MSSNGDTSISELTSPEGLAPLDISALKTSQESRHITGVGKDITLNSVRLDNILFDSVKVDSLTLTDCDVSRLVLSRCNIGTLRIVACDIRNLSIVSSKLMDVHASGSTMRGLSILRSKLAVCSFGPDLDLKDFEFQDMNMSELTVFRSKIQSGTFGDSTIGALSFVGSTLTKVDLSRCTFSVTSGALQLAGSTLTHSQALELHPLMCSELNIDLVDYQPGGGIESQLGRSSQGRPGNLSHVGRLSHGPS